MMNQSLGDFDPSICEGYDPVNDSVMQMLDFWIEGIFIVFIAVLGIIFNVGSTVILSLKEMRNSFNLLLIALSTFDTLYLVGSLSESLGKIIGFHSDIQIILIPLLFYPGRMIMMTTSVFMTIAIAMERYVAVHYPLDYNQAMNDERASLIRLLKYVVPVALFSVIFNIPKFLELHITYSSNSSAPQLEATPLRLDANYAIYYNNWTRLLILGIVPFVALVFFNTKIYNDIQVRRRHRCPKFVKRNSDTIENPPKGICTSSPPNANRRKHEDNLATVFLGIVGVFLICHIPRIVLSLHETVVIHDILQCDQMNAGNYMPYWVYILTYISHLLLVVNSSVNSIIYCGLSSRFRKQLLRFLGHYSEKFGFKFQKSSNINLQMSHLPRSRPNFNPIPNCTNNNSHHHLLQQKSFDNSNNSTMAKPTQLLLSKKVDNSPDETLYVSQISQV
nr:G-protein coupled receptor daf-37-like [Lepeophtheirus salmonis]